MRSTLAFVALVATAHALCACNDGALSSMDPDPVGADASAALCDPLAQTGCESDEKCTWIRDTGDPSASRNGCVACGPDALGCGAEIGDVCEVAAAGFDNCAAGGFCRDSRCVQVCDVLDASSCLGGSCTRVDAFGGTEAGVCLAGCEPGRDRCPDPDQICYATATGVGGVCR